MLKVAVLAVLQGAGENRLLTGAMVRRHLARTKPWLNPTDAELTEAFRLIHDKHETVTGIFSPDGEGHEFGIALKAKITALPDNCIMLIGATFG